MRGLVINRRSALRMTHLRVRSLLRLSWQGKACVVPAAVLSPLFKRHVTRNGINPTVALARRLGGSAPIGKHTPEHDVWLANQVIVGVRAAGRALPTEIVCLPRSLATWTILRRCGVAAKVIIGVDPTTPSMTAHAWVSVHNVDIGEQASQITRIEVFDKPLIEAPTT